MKAPDRTVIVVVLAIFVVFPALGLSGMMSADSGMQDCVLSVESMETHQADGELVVFAKVSFGEELFWTRVGKAESESDAQLLYSKYKDAISGLYCDEFSREHDSFRWTGGDD